MKFIYFMAVATLLIQIYAVQCKRLENPWKLNTEFLRSSIFPKYIPPYIRFVSDLTTVYSVPNELKQYLTWRTGHSQDSDVVNDIVQRSGTMPSYSKCSCLVVALNAKRG